MPNKRKRPRTTPSNIDTKPRIVTIRQLMKALAPYIINYPWAHDALIDLWKMGAPSPDPVHTPCPHGACLIHGLKMTPTRCEPIYGCARVRRLLLPSQFHDWWMDVQKRLGLNISTDGALQIIDEHAKDKGKTNGK